MRGDFGFQWREDPEYLRMGEELRETVEEILAKVDQMAVDYA